ncbi:MAG TPA: ABC transporter permease [Jiangellaceae bacterium]|nr:ABC transporter permease [Jiangellaceae bacterium]
MSATRTVETRPGLVAGEPRRAGRTLWSRIWPILAAVGIAVLIWQLVVWSGFRPTYVLPSPLTVAQELFDRLQGPELWQAIATTMRRAAAGFALSIVVGTGLGLAVARLRILRAAVGSLITGLQTMPSIAWFPLTILLLGFTEQAILFVVVLGAAPSIANGLISGIDDLPPQLMRAARVLGARGVTLYTSVVMPAVLPTYLAGLKQGWAFAWRSLMAGELLVVIAKQPSLGNDLTFAREFANAPRLIAVMIVILVIGMIVDGIFSAIANGVRRRRGLGALRL